MSEKDKIYQKFSDEELEYVYSYLDCDVDIKMFHKIEAKIRTQIKHFRDFDLKREAGV
jgi:hypothetical protein